MSTLQAVSSPPEDARLELENLALVRTIDERFQSFQIGMSHLTGGDTWIAYDAVGEGDTERDDAGDLSTIREPRAPADLANARLRTLAPTSVNFLVVADAGNPACAK